MISKFMQFDRDIGAEASTLTLDELSENLYKAIDTYEKQHPRPKFVMPKLPQMPPMNIPVHRMPEMQVP